MEHVEGDGCDVVVVALPALLRHVALRGVDIDRRLDGVIRAERD